MRIICPIVFRVFLAFLPLALSDKTDDTHIFEKFTKFNLKYAKSYSSLTAMTTKYQIFKDNYLQMLNQRNANVSSSVLGITQFMDIPFEEFKKRFMASNTTKSHNSSVRATQERDYIPVISQDKTLTRNNKVIKPISKIVHPFTAPSQKKEEIPESFDWRDHGVVSKVLNQGDCGACWAFSALVVIEGLYARKYGKAYTISPQQIIDCNGSNFSCSFGQIMGAMTYLKSFGGIPIDQYPLEGQKKECRYDSMHIEDGLAKVEEYHRLFDVDEIEMTHMLYSNGPLAVNINAAYFQFYKGGIMNPDDCGPFLNHGVAIVGYGVENAVLYWIIKNSWGEEWGEQGYLRLIRGKGQCGINTTVVTAVIQ